MICTSSLRSAALGECSFIFLTRVRLAHDSPAAYRPHFSPALCIRSLVMLDEIGRGTSTREGTALGVALLEWLDARGTSSGGRVEGGRRRGTVEGAVDASCATKQRGWGLNVGEGSGVVREEG